MTITISLADADGGTDIFAIHDGLPPGVPTADNEIGWRSSLSKLRRSSRLAPNNHPLPLILMRLSIPMRSALAQFATETGDPGGELLSSAGNDRSSKGGLAFQDGYAGMWKALCTKHPMF